MQKTNNNLIIKHFSRKREATALRLLLDVADKRGVSTPHILEGTQVTEADLSDPYFEIEAWQELVAIQNLVERDGDASLGIMSGLQQHLTCYGILGFAMMSCRNLLHALEIAGKFNNISLWINDVDVARHGDTIKFLILGHRLPEYSQNFLATRGMAALVVWVNELIGRAVMPVTCTFKIPKPVDAQEFEKCFGQGIQFGAKQYSISFERSVFAEPLKFRNRWTRMRSENELETTLEKRRSTVSNKARDLLLNLSDQKLSTEPAVCAALGHSTSTLRRRLHEEDCTFRQIQSEVIHERASQMLLSSTMTIDQIAYALGYSESGSFGRAFKRQAGCSPGAWRKKHTRKFS